MTPIYMRLSCTYAVCENVIFAYTKTLTGNLYTNMSMNLKIKCI